jgi:hypothetical protein
MHKAVKLEDETKIKASLKQEGMQERPLCGSLASLAARTAAAQNPLETI